MSIQKKYESHYASMKPTDIVGKPFNGKQMNTSKLTFHQCQVMLADSHTILSSLSDEDLDSLYFVAYRYFPYHLSTQGSIELLTKFMHNNIIV